MFIGLYPVVVSGQEYALTLAVVFWLDNESFSFPIVELLFKRFNIGG
jgi:hypothetical protein